jgi:hypothetical protein
MRHTRSESSIWCNQCSTICQSYSTIVRVSVLSLQPHISTLAAMFWSLCILDQQTGAQSIYLIIHPIHDRRFVCKLDQAITYFTCWMSCICWHLKGTYDRHQEVLVVECSCPFSEPSSSRTIHWDWNGYTRSCHGFRVPFLEASLGGVIFNFELAFIDKSIWKFDAVVGVAYRKTALNVSLANDDIPVLSSTV